MTQILNAQQTMEFNNILGCVLTNKQLNLMDDLYKKDPDTYEHCRRTSQYCYLIGSLLDLPDNDHEMLVSGALFHDIGKIAVADDVLKKPGSLTENERKSMQEHSKESLWLIYATGCSYDSVLAMLHHHERYDGSGYPSGLMGENIPLLARIISVADAYDAMTVKRCYSKGIGKEDALDRLTSGKGTQFDPKLIDVFAGYMTRLPQG